MMAHACHAADAWKAKRDQGFVRYRRGDMQHDDAGK
jgi:hypothetical protein